MLTAPLKSIFRDLCFNGLMFPSCISDETVRQLSAKDQLSKHYQVPVFKFIGKDNQVSREHARKFSCLVCPTHVLLCANEVSIMSVCENECVIKSVTLLCVLGSVPALPCAGVWAGTRGITLYAGLQKAFEATSLDRPAPRARRSV